jgi:hypothetical protein
MLANRAAGADISMKRRWAIAVLLGLSLVLVIAAASAATSGSSQDAAPHWEQLSAREKFAAYPDVAASPEGLIVVVWTEGANLTDKQNGSLRMAWRTGNSSDWAFFTLDDNVVYDAAVAVSDSHAFVVWSRNRNEIYYTTCTPSGNPPNANCGAPQRVTIAGEKALQVDIVVDNTGAPHLVWVEQDNRVYYTRWEGNAWRQKQPLTDHANPPGGEGPAIASAGNWIYLVWTEWQDDTHDNSQIKFCRRALDANDWSLCTTLSSWGAGDYLARNPSVTGDAAGNVYTVWDMLSYDDGGSERQYAIGYVHSSDNGQSWFAVHSFPNGDEFGRAESGAHIFRSVGGSSIEYIRYLRPQISLILSGTVPLPVLAWHAQLESGGSGEGLAMNLASAPHKVLWTYSAHPGSYAVPNAGDGYMYWATQPLTLSTDLCGRLNATVDSAAGHIAPVGDLGQLLEGGNPDDYLHTAYHESTGADFWGVFYNNTTPRACFDAYLPVMMRNASRIQE